MTLGPSSRGSLGHWLSSGLLSIVYRHQQPDNLSSRNFEQRFIFSPSFPVSHTVRDPPISGTYQAIIIPPVISVPGYQSYPPE